MIVIEDDQLAGKDHAAAFRAINVLMEGQKTVVTIQGRKINVLILVIVFRRSRNRDSCVELLALRRAGAPVIRIHTVVFFSEMHPVPTVEHAGVIVFGNDDLLQLLAVLDDLGIDHLVVFIRERIGAGGIINVLAVLHLCIILRKKMIEHTRCCCVFGIIVMLLDQIDRKAFRFKHRFAACGGGQCDALGFSV